MVRVLVVSVLLIACSTPGGGNPSPAALPTGPPATSAPASIMPTEPPVMAPTAAPTAAPPVAPTAAPTEPPPPEPDDSGYDPYDDY